MTSESLIASLGTRDDATLSLLLLTRALPTLSAQSLESLKDAIIHQLAQPATNKKVIAHLVAETVLLAPDWPKLHQFLNSPTSPLLLEIYTEAPQLVPRQDPTPFLNHGTTSLKFFVAFLKFVPFPAWQQYSHLFPFLFNALPTYLHPLNTDSLNGTLAHLIDLFDQTQRATYILKSHHSTLTALLLTLLSPPSTTTPTPRLEEDTYQLVLELLCCIVEYAEPLSFDDPEFLPSFIGVLLNLMAKTNGFAGMDSVDDESGEGENEEKEWLARADFSTNDEEEESIGFIAEGVLDRISLAIGGRIFPPIIEKLSAVLLSPLPSPSPSGTSSISRVHYSALSALATIAEGCAPEIIENLSGVISLILPSINSLFPRLRFAAIYALGQLCTDTEGAIQEEHGIEVLGALLGIVSGGAGEYRKLKAYATSCLVNYFQYPSTLPPLSPDTNTSIYPQLFYTLLALLRDETHLDSDSGLSPEMQREKNDWVKGHALEAIGSFAGCPGEDFSPYYQELMPTILGLLEHDALETRVRGEAGGLSAGIRDRLIDCSASIAIVIPSPLLQKDSYRLTSALYAINAHNRILDQSSRAPSTAEEIDGMAERVMEKESTFQYLLSAFLRLAEAIPFAGATAGVESGGRSAGESGRERFIIPFLQNQALPILLTTAMASLLSASEQVNHSDATTAEEEEDEEDLAATREESLVAVENLVMLVQALDVPIESIRIDGGPLRLRGEELGRIREVALATIADVDHLAIREAAAALLAVTSKSLSTELPAPTNRQLFSESTLAISSHLIADPAGEITSSLLASWVTILISLPHLDATDLRTGKEYYLSDEALDGFIGSLGNVLERVRGREMDALASVSTAEVGGEEEPDEGEEELAWDDERYYDESILNSVYRAIHLLNGYYSTAGKMDRISKFNAFLGLLNFPSNESIPVFRFSRRFALRYIECSGVGGEADWVVDRLLASIIVSSKGESFSIAAQYLPSVTQSLLDTDVEIREYSARVIISIVDLPPSERSAYGGLIRESVGGLVGSIGEIELDDERVLIARDVAIAAIAKIIQAASSDSSLSIDLDNLLPIWLSKLPVMISSDSFPIVVALLLQLIESNHPSLLSPTLPAHHILKILISFLDNPNLPSSLLPSLTDATKSWLRASDPLVAKELFETMPEGVQERLMAE